MSLRVWLPLNGDLRNNGLDDINFNTIHSSTSVNDNGKIGKCYNNNSLTSGGIISDKNIDLGKTFSMFCWFNFTSLGSTASLGCCLVTNHSYPNNYGSGLTIKYVSSTTGYLSINTGTGSSRTFNTYCGTTLLQANTWYHGGVTYDGSKFRIYVNGILEKEVDYNQYNVPNRIGLFMWSVNSDGTYFNTQYKLNGKLNDVRIYDHALSAKEVKELSKGLVCHYKLDNGSFGGQDNIYDFQSVVSKWTADGATKEDYTDSVYGNVVKVISSSGNKRIYRNVSNVWTQGQKYAVSFLAKADSSCVCDMSRSLINFTQQFTLTTEWKRYSGVIDCTATATGGTLSFRVVTTGVNAYITQIKLEYGEIATAYRPNINDPDYNKLGYNDNIVYDSSGYNYHGNKMTDTISCSVNTIRNSLSTNFNGVDDGILIENLDLSPIINNSATYSFWIKPNGENGARSVYFGMWTGTSWSIEKTTNNLLRSYWAGSPDEICSETTITDGQWQHICVVKNGANSIKAYINGVLKWTSTATHSNLNFATTCRIGRDTRSGDGTPYKGLMSDFRIYATALSDEDIKELYNTPISIAKNGSILTQGEYIEV